MPVFDTFPESAARPENRAQPFQIRPARPADAPALAHLLRSLKHFPRIEQEPPETTLANVTRELDLCLAGDSHAVMLAVLPAERLAGYIAVHWLPYLIHAGPEAYISELFIHPEARGQGLGSALLDWAISAARQRGCRRLSLLNMRDRESYLRAFYKKRGWEERADAANFILVL